MPKQIYRGLIALLVVAWLLFATVPVLAADLRNADTVTVGITEVINDDLYIIGGDIVINGTVNGDIFGAGSSITINGIVNGGVTMAGQTITVNGKITHGARLAGNTISVNGNIEGDLLAAGNTVNVASTAIIGNDLLFGAATAHIAGTVEGYIKGGGNKVVITDKVGENVDLQVEELTITSTANIQGNLTYASKNVADIQSGAKIAGTTTHAAPRVREPAGPLAKVGARLIAFLMTLLTGIVIILIAPRKSAAVAASIRHKPLMSLGWGAIILFATPVAAIITFFTVVGVPIGLLCLALYGALIYLSQIAVGLFIGRWVIGYFSKVDSRGVLVGSLALGFAILTLLKLIPYLGFPLWLATALFGIGAIALSQKTLLAKETNQN